MSRHTGDVILLALVMLIIGHLSITTAESESTRAYCTEQWPNDFRMQEHCYESEIKALRSFVRMSQSRGFMDENYDWTQAGYDHALSAPIARCLNTWKLDEFETHNWRMVEHCAKEQIAAYERIHGKIDKK